MNHLAKSFVHIFFLTTCVNFVYANDKLQQKDFTFATFKFGVDQPNASGGNTKLSETESTYSAGIEIGHKFKQLFGLSFEYKKIGASNYTINNEYIDGKNVSSTWSGKSDVFFLNMSTDVIESSIITPYVKFGLGWAVNRASDFVVSESETNAQQIFVGSTNNSFAWQGGLGLDIKSTELFDVIFEYMYLDRGKMKTSSTVQGSLSSKTINKADKSTNLTDHTLMIGLMAKF